MGHGIRLTMNPVVSIHEGRMSEHVPCVPPKFQALVTVLLYSAHLKQILPLLIPHVCTEFLYVLGTELGVRFRYEPDTVLPAGHLCSTEGSGQLNKQCDIA